MVTKVELKTKTRNEYGMCYVHVNDTQNQWLLFSTYFFEMVSFFFFKGGAATKKKLRNGRRIRIGPDVRCTPSTHTHSFCLHALAAL
jgi:hypothetical protein